MDGAAVRFNLFVRGADGKLWERYWNGGGWIWSDTGRMVAGDPVAVVRGDRGDLDGSDLRVNSARQPVAIKGSTPMDGGLKPKWTNVYRELIH